MSDADLLGDGSKDDAEPQERAANPARALEQAHEALDRIPRPSRGVGSARCERSRVRGLGDVLSVLDSLANSVPGILQAAPTLICRLGFDRVLLSRVENGLWLLEKAHIINDSEWADRIDAVGKKSPQRLVPNLFETEIVRRRKALVVRDVQNETRVHRPIAEVSRADSYAAAPIVAGGKVVGLLHADRYLQRRDIDESDLDTLVAFSCGLQLALGRARLLDRIRAFESVMTASLGELRDDPCTRGDEWWSSAPAEPAGVRRGSETTHAVLTGRERQILEMIAEGKTNNDIRDALFIAEDTVKKHVMNILRKLGAKNRPEAVAKWYEAGNITMKR